SVSGTGAGLVPQGFAGGVYDPETGLVRFGARDYDPITGRWNAKDPLTFGGDGPNLFGYVLNDPVNFTDPTGECIPCLIGAAAAAGFLIACVPKCPGLAKA